MSLGPSLEQYEDEPSELVHYMCFSGILAQLESKTLGETMNWCTYPLLLIQGLAYMEHSHVMPPVSQPLEARPLPKPSDVSPPLYTYPQSCLDVPCLDQQLGH